MGQIRLARIGQILFPRPRPEEPRSENHGVRRFFKPLSRIIDYPDRAADLTYESIAAWHNSDDFQKISAMFSDYPEDSLVGGIARELLYHIIRSTKAKNVIEVGTYFAATSEVMTRALWENGDGTLHTTDPFGAERGPPIIAEWPIELRRHIQFYPLNSMGFFMKLEADQVTVDVAFIDGNHDYEFAYFDLCSAARRMRSGGIVLMDNIEQPGPFWAALEFLRANPDWVEIGNNVSDFNPDNPFDERRTFIGNTHFVVLKAPSKFVVKTAPRTIGTQSYAVGKLSGLRLVMASPAPNGILHVQIFLRGFSDTRALEQLVAVAQAKLDGHATYELTLSTPLETKISEHHMVELILFWQPNGHTKPLELTEPPTPFAV